MDNHIYFNLNPINFLIISGILQIFILSGVLFVRNEGHYLSNRLLSLLLVLVNSYLTYLMILDLNLDNLFPWLLWFPYSYLLAIGPLIYFYTLSFTQPDFILSEKVMVHFLPLGIELALQVFQISWAISTNEMYYNVFSDAFISPLIYFGTSVSIFIYLKKSLIAIQNHEQAVVHQFSEMRKKTLDWLFALISYYRLFWFVWIPFAVVFLTLFRGQIQNVFTIISAYLLLLFLTYLTYWIGLQGLLKGSAMNLGDFLKSAKKGSYDHLPENEIEGLIIVVKTAMEEHKAYLNPSLSLKEFAGMLDREPNLISFILNRHLQKTFYELVNTYRINAVKEMLSQNKAEGLTLLAIALECGFNSKTSFNRVFKEMNGVTPSQYLKKISNN
ncbi:MAG: helix-turn-helix domain-containing protein [Ekhidna sp.]